MRAIRAAFAAGTVILLSACGTAPHGAAGSTVGRSPGVSPSLQIVISPSNSDAFSPLAPGRPNLTVPSSVSTGRSFLVTGRCPVGGYGLPTADLEVRAPGQPPGGTPASVDADGNVTRPVTLDSQRFQRNGRALVTLTCTRSLDANRTRTTVLTVNRVIAVTSTYRAATLTVPVRTVAVGGRLHIQGRCPYPGATASAYVTDAAGPALQQLFPVARDGRFDASIDLSRKVNAPRPAGKPALQPGAGSIGIGCTAGSETSVGQAVPITITGPTPTPPPAMQATVRVAPTRVARGDSVVVIGTCPKDTWFVSITASDRSGVFTSTGAQVGPALTFNTSLAMAVGPNKASGHPASIVGSTVTVKATCNRLPNGGGDILFSAAATVQLG